ncbi:MAG TPA: hypothetical protein VEF05_07620 [Terriglobales bacterium]|nr:hypothetical protein [Terriglobales bacterium]
MVEDPKWELAILATVQGFYEKLLQEAVGGEVPVPTGLEAVSLQSDDDLAGTLSTMHRWLRLLDLAISPAMLRRAFTADTDPEIAEAVLRYFTRKKDSSDTKRDKTDLVVTFLYRHPRVPGQWERRGYGLDGSLPLSPFEIALIEILADSEVPPLSEEQTQLLRQFDRLQEEAQNVRDLNALLESAIIARVRELKQSFGSSFYHPGVLATIAPYNAAFGRRFDELFLDAAAQIKRFARELEEQGGSILGTVDGVDVTVDHIAALSESELLRIDYGIALEKFRRVSRLRRSLEQRPPMRRAPRPIAPQPASGDGGQRVTARPVIDVTAMRAAVTPQQISTEESKLLRVEESVRVFVRVADPKFRQVVPMRFFNLILTPAEADAYCADYLEEKSLRAQVARAVLRLVAVVARMNTELEELRRADSSPSLWKLHADSLIVLLEVERSVHENTGRVITAAKQQGAASDVETLQASQRKLNDCSALALKALTAKPAEKVVGAGSGT